MNMTVEPRSDNVRNGGPGVIKIWGPRRFGDPPSPILRRNGDPRVKMGTLTHTVVGKGRSLSNLS